MNDRIVNSAWWAVRGDLTLPARGGLCLALVRIVIEHAMGWPSHRLYDWRTHRVEGRPATSTPWARDMERSLRAAGMMVPLPPSGESPDGDPHRYVSTTVAEPGDLLFRWDTARNAQGQYVGHVGILMPGGLVLENVSPAHRDASEGVRRGPTALTPVGTWPVTTVIRFDPNK